MRAMELAMIQTRAARAMGLFAAATFVIVMLAVPRITQDQRYHDFQNLNTRHSAVAGPAELHRQRPDRRGRRADGHGQGRSLQNS